MLWDLFANLFDRLRSEDALAVLLELLLIGVSVNWIASVLHGTRGTRLLRGLLVMVVAATLIVQVFSVQQEWTRLRLLYQYFITALAFIAVVAFQPELRRALIRAGEVSFLRRSTPESRLIAALVESAGYLSRKKYGALIAIQRDVGLRNWAENGTPINGQVTANLLNAIFFPNSPLHDLGVIISGDRVVAANCQFPQTDSGEFDMALGSRHRAAVGLSQESDALVIVVSEETGTISLADGGKLIRYLSLDDLSEELKTRLRGKIAAQLRVEGGVLARVLRASRRLLVIVPVTLVIWFLADQASLTEARGLEVALEIKQPPGYQVDVESPTPFLFSATFRGTTRAIDALKAQVRGGQIRFAWTPPKEALVAGRYRLGATQLLAMVPMLSERGITVQEAAPAEVLLNVDTIETVEMKIEPDVGRFNVSSLRADPETARVTLRSGDLDRLRPEERVVAARVPDEMLRRVATDAPERLEGVPLDLRVGSVAALRVEPREVSVSLRVVGRHKTRRLANVVVRISASPEVHTRYSIIPVDSTEWLIDLDVEGDESRIDALDPARVRAYVEITNEDAAAAATAVRSAEVEVDLPDGLTLVGPKRSMQYQVVPRETSKP